MFHPSDSIINFEGELRTLSFAAEKFTCSKDHVIQLVNDGDLKYVDIARANSKYRDIRFTDEQLDQFARERTRQRSPLPVKQPRAKAEKQKAAFSNADTFEERMLKKHGCQR
jgi:hypothetical protein